ncbi:MAG: transcriptional regulator [Treponema sp.]|nr:transcriptional regulator [Treponema sp.]
MAKKQAIKAIRAEKIKVLLIKRGKKLGELAELLQIAPQSLSRKMKIDNFNREEMERIGKWLKATYAEEFTCRFTLNDTGEEI